MIINKLIHTGCMLFMCVITFALPIVMLKWDYFYVDTNRLIKSRNAMYNSVFYLRKSIVIISNELDSLLYILFSLKWNHKGAILRHKSNIATQNIFIECSNRPHFIHININVIDLFYPTIFYGSKFSTILFLHFVCIKHALRLNVPFLFGSFKLSLWFDDLAI